MAHPFSFRVFEETTYDATVTHIRRLARQDHQRSLEHMNQDELLFYDGLTFKQYHKVHYVLSQGSSSFLGSDARKLTSLLLPTVAFGKYDDPQHPSQRVGASWLYRTFLSSNASLSSSFGAQEKQRLLTGAFWECCLYEGLLDVADELEKKGFVPDMTHHEEASDLCRDAFLARKSQ